MWTSAPGPAGAFLFRSLPFLTYTLAAGNSTITIMSTTKQIVSVDAFTSRVELTQGHWTTISTDDLTLVDSYGWCLHRTRGKLYAKSSRGGRTIYLHRLIMGVVDHPGVLVDHRDSAGLNNVRLNLRLPSPQQNSRNSAG